MFGSASNDGGVERCTGGGPHFILFSTPREVRAEVRILERRKTLQPRRTGARAQDTGLAVSEDICVFQRIHASNVSDSSCESIGFRAKALKHDMGFSPW